MQNHNDTNDKGRAKTSLTKYVPLTLFVMFACERELETEQNCNILTPTLMAVSVVSFSFSRCSTGGPGAQLSAGWWLSLLHLINNFSGPQLIRAPRASSAWCGFPYQISSLTPTVWLFVSTELYNSSMPTSIAYSIFGMACLIVIKQK